MHTSYARRPDGMEVASSSNGYLKLMIKAFNEEQFTAQPLTLKNLENLESFTFRRILIFLINQTGMCDRRGLEMEPRYEIIANPELSILCPLWYESSMDHLFWALKDLFPPNDDLVSYYLLFFPYKDGKRTKQVLNYITSYALFCDQSIERFEMIHDEVQEEHKLRQELQDAIDSYNTRKTDRIVYLEDSKEQLPTFVEIVRETTSALTLEQVEVAQIEVAVHESKAEYDKFDLERLRLIRQLEDVVAQRNRYESQIIHDPESRMKVVYDEQRKFDELLEEKDQISRRIQDLHRARAAAEPILNKADLALNDLQETVAYMEEVGRIQDALTSYEDETERKEKLLEKIHDRLMIAKSHKEKVKARLNEKQKEKIRRKENLVKKIKQTREKTYELHQKRLFRQETQAEVNSYYVALREMNKETKLKIFESLEFLEVTVPEIMKIIVSETEQAYERILTSMSVDSDIY